MQPPEHRDEAYLWDMLTAARKISKMVNGKKYRDFHDDETLHYAVERLIEIIGEATKRVSEKYKEAHPRIPWKRIAGQRDVLIHDYDEVLLEKIWVVASKDTPDLIAALEPLAPNKEPSE